MSDSGVDLMKEIPRIDFGNQQKKGGPAMRGMSPRRFLSDGRLIDDGLGGRCEPG